jgi:hypothetical protein
MDWERFFIGMTLTGFAGLIVCGLWMLLLWSGVADLGP